MRVSPFVSYTAPPPNLPQVETFYGTHRNSAFWRFRPKSTVWPEELCLTVMRHQARKIRKRKPAGAEGLPMRGLTHPTDPTLTSL